MRVVLATHNAGKVAEFAALLAPLQIELLSLRELAAAAPEETGLSFVENAVLKARQAAALAGLPAIADDSGLEVDALRGAPGIYSARYAGAGAGDAANLRKLLAELAHVPAELRSARFRCALAFMRWDLDPAPLIAQASWEGRIVTAPRGSGGFGYDPVFEIAGSTQTAAELPLAAKNSQSHRGQALRHLVEQLAAFAAQSAGRGTA
jgi:XTP/dITP diphosphohydrolase